MPNISWITPNWPAASCISALTTTRSGGVSLGPYASFNLAQHVQDDPKAVSENRKLLREYAKLPAEPCWISQVHGIEVIHLENFPSHESAEFLPQADAAISKTPGKIAAVLTADCLPILLCNEQGTEVAAVHAGWRGLSLGVIEATIRQMSSAPSQMIAWLGPAIGPKAFEVGIETKTAFQGPQDETAFLQIAPEKWLADIYQLARFRLQALQVSKIFGGEYCTFTGSDHFYSYRRSNPCGRMASLIWINPKTDKG